MAEATARPSTFRGMPFQITDGVLAAVSAFARPLPMSFRDRRILVPLCILSVCASLSAVAALQMGQDRGRALAQAQAAQTQRVQDIARIAAASLDRHARLGAVFAASPQQYRAADLARAEPAIRDIAVYDTGGRILSRLRITGGNMATPLAVFSGGRVAFPGGIAFRDGDHGVSLLFDPASLVPAPLLDRAALVPANEAGKGIAAAVPGWPLVAVTQRDASAAGNGASPLALFLILAPLLAGVGLSALFLHTVRRQARTANAIRALRATRPVEARLLVRLAQAERGAAEALRAKSEFIAHMSHELRTPLNAVIGFSEIIADGLYGPPGHAKYAEYARDIGDAGKSLHARIGDVLEFANIEAGRHPLVPARVELCAVALAAVEDHKGRAFSRRIGFDIGIVEPVTVRADAQAVRRVLSNLIDNALRYTAEGGTVLVDVRAGEGAGLLVVRDSGGGFTSREQDRAGEPFQRFDRRGTVTGAGLGLAIAMELTRRMGGAVNLSGTAQGAVMEVRLPRL